MFLQAYCIFLSYRINNCSWNNAPSIFMAKDNSPVMYFKNFKLEEKKAQIPNNLTVEI